MRAPLLVPAIVLVGVTALLGVRDAGTADTTEHAAVRGTVVGDVVREGESAAFPFATDAGPLLRADVPGDAVAGERLEIDGTIAPFDGPRNPGEPSPRRIARAQGFAATLHGRIVARAPPDRRDARAWAAELRAALSARLRRAIPSPQADVLAGALWGERGTLPHALHADFQATGTVHVLVTAGLHLGIVAGLVLALLRLCGVPRIAAALGAIPAVIGYAWLSGAHLPSERAATMAVVALVARACGGRVASWNALALGAIVIALADPLAVATVSFALSFSCVAAILLFAGPLARAFERLPLPQRVREALALTVATQTGVWPLSAATFGLVAPYAVLANAVVVPATALGMLGGIATLAAVGVPVLGDLVARLTTLDVDAVIRTVAAIAALPGAQVAVAPPPALAIVGYDIAALVAARLLATRPRRAAAVLAAASVLVLATTLRFAGGGLTITVLDVGQGDGIVVRTPAGKTILFDAGGRLERGPDVGGVSPAELVGERIVLAYLRREGIREVALLVLTHPHGDHVGGCAPIVRALKVDAIADSGQRYGGRAYRDCLAAARERHVPVVLARRGMRWASGDGVTLDVLAPSMPYLADTGDDVNENSIVAMLRYGGFRALFMGDAGEASEARLLVFGDDLRAAVLKVGHHGSRYASTAPFLAAVRPAIALISVGRHNTFGHPAPETIGRLDAAGARVLRTDRCGALRVVADTGTATSLLCR